MVRMPRSLPSGSVTGTPEMRYFCIMSRASATFCSGRMVMGLVIIPASERLTRSTPSTCCSRLMFLWMMPIPPCRAMATARLASVTVSMAAETSGMFSRMALVSSVVVSTCWGWTVEWAGSSDTSSKVRARGGISSSIRVSYEALNNNSIGPLAPDGSRRQDAVIQE